MIDALTLPSAMRAGFDRRPSPPPRILLAEDDAEMRDLLAFTLRKRRYGVVVATDGAELLERLTESVVHGPAIDCIVTDVRMPDMTGIEALRYIKEAGLVIPAIVITAFGDRDTRLHAWRLGAVTVLDKPFEIEDLVEQLEKLGFRPDPVA